MHTQVDLYNIGFNRSSRSDKKFDVTIGHIEDIIMGTVNRFKFLGFTSPEPAKKFSKHPYDIMGNYIL